MIDAGRTRLETPGAPAATRGEMIAAGILAAAVAAPWPAPATPTERLKQLREAHFAGDVQAAMPPQEMIDALYEEVGRLHQVRINRLPEEPIGRYREWHRGGGTNVPGAITKVLTARGVDKKDARRAVVEVCWRSVWYSASAVSAAMRFWLAEMARYAADEIGESLTGREVALFELLYAGVPETYGIPLAVLYERLDVVEPWLAALARQPGEVAPDWGTFYAVLGAYSDIAGSRREVDVEKKRKAAKTKQRSAVVPRKTAQSDNEGHAPKAGAAAVAPANPVRRAGTRGRTSQTPQRAQAAQARRRSERNALSEVIEQFSAGLQCSCRRPDWTYTTSQQDESLDLTYTCRVCATERTVTRTVRQFTDLCRRV